MAKNNNSTQEEHLEKQLWKAADNPYNEVPEIYSFELLDTLFTQVYCKYAFLVEKGIASRNTASKYLN